MIRSIPPDLSRSQAIEQLSENDLALLSLIKEKNLDYIEIQSLISYLSIGSQVIRNKHLDKVPLWEEVMISSGYSIWKYPIDWIEPITPPKQLYVWTNATKPEGQPGEPIIGFNTDTKQLEFWTGEEWRVLG